MLAHSSGVDVSSSALRFLAARRGNVGALSTPDGGARVRAGRPCSRSLTCATASPMPSSRPASGVGTTTVYRYVNEAVELLAALAPTLGQGPPGRSRHAPPPLPRLAGQPHLTPTVLPYLPPGNRPVYSCRA